MRTLRAREVRHVSSTPLVIAGPAHPALAEAIARELPAELATGVFERFPDGECAVRLDVRVRGRTALLVQPLGPPVGEHLLQLLLAADACRRGGAAQVLAVAPYLGYARQDRVGHEGEALGARVLADALACARLSGVLAVDVHSPVIAACVHAPLVHLTAVPLLAEALRPHARSHSVVVAPDLGAVKLAEAYARALGLPLAVVHKHRVSGKEVAVRNVVGVVNGRRAIIVDDMISTGATVIAALEALLAQGGEDEVTVAATHGLFSGEAATRLDRPEIAHVLTTDSLPAAPRLPSDHATVPLAPLLAEALRRLLSARGLEGLLAER